MRREKSFFVKFSQVVALLFVFAFSLPDARAADFGKPGTVEYGGSLGFSYEDYSADGFSAYIVRFKLQGYAIPFVSEGFGIGLAPAIDITDPEGADALINFSLALKPEYNMITEGLYPYFGPEIGFFIIDSGGYESVKGMNFGFEAGVKIKINEGSLVRTGFKFQYQKPLNDPYDEMDIIYFLFTLGFSLFN